MKKMIAVFSLLSILTSVLSLSSCQKPVSDPFNIAQTKEIVLGDEVDSVELKTAEGKTITCVSGADFYEIFNQVSLPKEAGKKLSYLAETKMGENSKTVSNMNVYPLENGEFLEITSKKEGEDAFSVIEQYWHSKKLSDGKFEQCTFAKYTYRDEQAFGGQELGANGYKTYISDAYPVMPQTGTELLDMQVRAGHLMNFLSFGELFQSYESYEANNKTYDFDQFVTREYTLYENYIVFKQTAPFIYFRIYPGDDPALLYASFSNADCSITQEAYCNVKTGEIEFVKVYGDTLWYVPEHFGTRMEIQLQLYIHDVGESVGNQKIDQLIEYIKSNANTGS